MSEKQVQIRNIKAEILLIKAFTTCGKQGREAILDRVSEEHFGSKIGKLVWKRACILHTNRNLPYKGGWNVLVNDPVLHNKQPVLDILEQFDDAEVSKKSKFVLELTRTLEFFKQKRDAYYGIEEAYGKLADAEDQNDISEALVPLISAAHTVTDVRAKDAFFRLDTLNLLETLRIAKAKRGSNNLARTLWPQFDSINSGFSFGSLITIAATTSGGKSVIAFINLMIGFALQGLKVAGASLEMSKEQIAERQAAFVSGVPMHKIRAGKWTPEEEEHINRSSQLLLELIAKRGGSYWILKQLKKDSSIGEMLTLLYEKGPNVILIDYINLLRLPSGKDKWEALGEVAREAKVFADSHDCLVILLAQLNEEERVKYSKAVEEHSDNVIIWSYPPQNRPGFIQVKQTKARNQIPYSFYLVEDFSNMRIYDLLEPIGLALMLSRSSGKSFRSKTNEYFGMRRLVEIQDVIEMDSLGIPKHKFIEDIDWHNLVDQSVPAPNVPDISTIMDMVREMLSFIGSYEPMAAKLLLDNLKASDILKPFEEFIDDLELPNSVKIALGETKGNDETPDAKKKKLLEKIERDFLSATQDLYIEGDKIVREDRRLDNVTPRNEVYEATNEQIHNGKDPEKPLRKRGRKKEVIDPSVSESKWLRANSYYSRKKQMKADTTPYRNQDGGSPLDSMKSVPKEDLKALNKAAKSKESLIKYKKHWKKLSQDSPSSPDTIKETMLLEGGIDEPEFLLGSCEKYINELEHNIEIVGYFLDKKVGRINNSVQALLSSYLTSNKGMETWNSGFKNECRVKKFTRHLTTVVLGEGIELHAVVEGDKKKLPSVDNLLKELKVSKEHKVFLNKVVKKAKSEQQPPIPLIDIGLEASRIDDKLAYIKEVRGNGHLESWKPLLESSEIIDSPYIVLFSKPQFIGSITPKNYCIKAPFLSCALKTGVIMRLFDKDPIERDKLVRSIAWALANPNHRDNRPLLEAIRQSILGFMLRLSNTSEIVDYYCETLV